MSEELIHISSVIFMFEKYFMKNNSLLSLEMLLFSAFPTSKNVIKAL